MRNKLSVVLSVFFMLLLTSCSLFKDPNFINIKEPRERDALVQGENFLFVADIDLHHGVAEMNVDLFSVSGTYIRDSLDSLIYVKPYDSVLWRYDSFDEDVNLMGKYKIEKEITVPPDVPEGEFYFLQVNYLNWDGYSGYANTVQVSIMTPEMYKLMKEAL